MEVTCELLAPAALIPREDILVTINWEIGWGPKAAVNELKESLSPLLEMALRAFDLPDRSMYVMHTELSRHILI